MEQIEYITGRAELLDKIHKVQAWRPFDERTITFCDELSKDLLNNRETQIYPDLVALAFWLRKSNIQSVKKNYLDLTSHLGKGLVFHIAPGNMALSFAYSLATGLLTGNTNIIRLPSRNFKQADIFCEVLNNKLENNQEMSERICLIKYPHDKKITDDISMKCHMRIIWGGDNTINTIRQSPLLPRAGEISFANRYSVCVINSDRYLDEYDEKKVAHGFYNDTYLSDQNACSSPRILYWMGDRITEAKERFWSALCEKLSNYDMAAVTTSDKLLTFCKYASKNQCHMSVVKDYKIMRIEVDSIDESVLYNIGNSGYFYECSINDICEILPICKWELQTLSYIGIDPEKIKSMIIENGVDGVDRIVPVGKTMDFDFFWDGKDIIREMTRRVSVM